MKKIILALLLLLLFKAAFAQKDSLSFDDRNKYIYYHVVEQPRLTVDTFQNRAQYFLRNNYKDDKVFKSTDPSVITGGGIFLVLSGITAAKHVDGEIDYMFHIEYKDQKYRYWLTDFLFIPYKVDRYGNSVPQSGLDVALEDGAKKLTKSEFSSYLDKTGTFSRQFGDKLKQYMVKVSTGPAKGNLRKTISTKSW